MNKGKLNEFYRQEFYKKWGTYQNYLNWKNKNPKPEKKKGKYLMKVVKHYCPVCGNLCEAVMIKERMTMNVYFMGHHCLICGLKEKIENL